ncbi:MAG: hypothetical protein KA802_11760 [Saprospiraceae bacterium]|nr:hypothetical protein [Saprospiraceae bacterium]MBP8892709.1 hypothetical protein [Saprospiraceae bacterium]
MNKIEYDSAFYPNGRLWIVTPIQNGKMDGLEEWYHKNGNLQKKIRYKNNMRDGPWIEYYDYGYMKQHGYYKNNARDSIWIETYYNKNLKSQGSYFPDINYLVVDRSDSSNFQLVTQNKDRIEIERQPLTSELLTKLQEVYGNSITRSLAFPIEIHFKDKLWEYWDEEGKLIKEEIWDKGEIISITIY